MAQPHPRNTHTLHALIRVLVSLKYHVNTTIVDDLLQANSHQRGNLMTIILIVVRAAVDCLGRGQGKRVRVGVRRGRLCVGAFCSGQPCPALTHMVGCSGHKENRWVCVLAVRREHGKGAGGGVLKESGARNVCEGACWEKVERET